MKHILLVAFMAIIGTGTTYAQKNTVVGKWTFASMSSPEFSIDLENPAAAKKFLVDEIKKEGGQVPDSATLDMAFNMMASAFNAMMFEFTADGNAIFSAPGDEGSLRKETAKYTVDYTKGILTTIETLEGKKTGKALK